MQVKIGHVSIDAEGKEHRSEETHDVPDTWFEDTYKAISDIPAPKYMQCSPEIYELFKREWRESRT